MSESALPILGSEGWVTDPNLIMTRALAHAYESDYSQSTVGRGNITSIQYVISLWPNNTIRLSAEMENMLKDYFSRWFTDVEVTFRETDDSKATDNPKMIFKLEVSGYRNDLRHDLSRILMIDTTSGTSAFKESIGL
jgi:hypothetical protein